MKLNICLICVNVYSSQIIEFSLQSAKKLWQWVKFTNKFTNTMLALPLAYVNMTRTNSGNNKWSIHHNSVYQGQLTTVWLTSWLCNETTGSKPESDYITPVAAKALLFKYKYKNSYHWLGVINQMRAKLPCKHESSLNWNLHRLFTLLITT